MLFDFYLHFIQCKFILPIFFKNKCTSLTYMYWYLILSIFVVLLCLSSMSAYPCTTLISHCNLQENYRMGGSFVWPTVAKVAEYRKKVRKAILDVIDNTPLELPVTQESKWVRWTKTHIIIIIIIIIFIEGAQLAKAVFSGALINDWTVNSKPLLRDLEACREFMTLQLAKLELGNVLHRGHYLHGGAKMNSIFSWWKQYFYESAERVCGILFFTTRK